MVTPRETSRRENLPETFFAPAARANSEDLQKTIDAVSRSPIVDSIMRTFGGLIAILNEERQIVTLNYALLDSLGVPDAAEALGLRPGEAAGCVHAHDHPGGCGTSQYCSTCGAAIAIVASLRSGVPEDRECVLTIRRDDKTKDIDFAVRCAPIEMQGMRLLLLFLRDMSEDKRRGALEQTFFHDVKSLLASLSVAGDMLADAHKQDVVVKSVRHAIAMLAKEVEVQQSLVPAGSAELLMKPQVTSVSDILERTRKNYVAHSAAVDRRLAISVPGVDTAIVTDPSLVQRVLMNLITNALEATPVGGEVRVWTEPEAGVTGPAVRFLIWNATAIAPDVSARVFQRYFSTKAGIGRGFGLFTARWLADRHLRGEVTYTSDDIDGTTFSLSLPLHL
jgi:signal transduction histidine kinase